MTDRVQGRCWACGVSGPEDRQRNFLCGSCAHPQEVRSYCAGCQHRRSYTLVEAAALCASHDINHPIGLGIVIVLAHCARCSHTATQQKIEIHSIAA